MSQQAAAFPLLRVFQLVSQSLPVGAFAYSQGLEAAVEAGWVHDEQSLADWLSMQLNESLARTDLPILARLSDAIRRDDEVAQLAWCQRLVAMRETSELRCDDCDRGRALARLMRDLAIPLSKRWRDERDVPYAQFFALLASAWQIPLATAVEAYAWGWLENQVLAGVKLIPLGQVAGQRLLLELAGRIPAICRRALDTGDDEIGGTLPIVALASSRHETQYTRLFRS